MIEQATGAGDDDLGAATERAELAAHANAAVDGGAVRRCAGPDR
jgi:hypothetical protein